MAYKADDVFAHQWPVPDTQMHIFDRAQYSRLLRKAQRSARRSPGREICGLIVDTGHHLALVELHNVSRRAGGFVFSGPDVRRIVAAARVLGQEVVGTFHSHPVGLATPGQSDIENAVDDSLMFILDCLGRESRLWKIKRGKARNVRFDFLDKSRCTEVRFSGAT